MNLLMRMNFVWQSKYEFFGTKIKNTINSGNLVPPWRQ